jgi:hypothetical protein
MKNINAADSSCYHKNLSNYYRAQVIVTVNGHKTRSSASFQFLVALSSNIYTQNAYKMTMSFHPKSPQGNNFALETRDYINSARS